MERVRFSKLSIAVLALVLLGATFFTGAWYGYERRPGVVRVFNVLHQEQPQEFHGVDFDLFWNVWSRLEEKYVDKDKIDREKLIFGAIQGLTRSLGDPYTEFLPPAETKQFQEDIKGSFDGIGAEIGIRKGVLTIISPLKGSPAERVGLKAGDKVLKVNDTITADLTLDEAVRMIRGPRGTEVRLMILRDSFEKTKEFKIIRDTIKVQILSTEKKEDGIFIIKLNSFTESASREFRKALQEFFDANSKKLLLDLRNNPGGFLNIAVDIASWWMSPGEIVVNERYADGSEDVYRSVGYRLLENIPTVILINEGSASASEIVAGALRDIKGIKLVGTKTFGKGSVQEVENLPRGSSLKITIAKWLTPKGDEINNKGLEPDIKVELSKEENGNGKAQEKDMIMEKGIEVLKGL